MQVLDEAEEYELFGYPNTEIQDCNFLEDVFITFGHKIHDILDVACGTGRHALEMARRGYTVTGVDISGKMLNVAIRKASAQNIHMEFMQRDMIKLDFKEEFDAAYIIFNTILLLTQNEDLIRFLNGVRDSLRADGVFVIEAGNLWLISQGASSRTVSRRGMKRKLE